MTKKQRRLGKLVVRVLPPGLGHARRGSVALLFALLLIPIVGAIAIAIDDNASTQAQAQLSLALDSATMQAVNNAVSNYAANAQVSLAAAEQAGVQRFTAQAGTVQNVIVQPVTITVTQQGSTFTAKGSYTATYTTYLGALFDVANIGLSDTASATETAPSYKSVRVMMDASSSMLIGASPTDITNLMTVTQPASNFAPPAPQLATWNGGCAFACHWDANNNDFYNASRLNGITLRLDQLKTAVGTLAAGIASATPGSQYTLGLYTFENALTQVVAPTTNVASVGTAATNVAPPYTSPYAAPSVSADLHDTEVTESIYAMAQNYLPESGDGSSAASPKQYVVLMTDGVEDVGNPNNPNDRIVSAVDPASCAAMRSTGATVMVIHTEYYNANGQFNEINAIQNQVDTNLQACASTPSLYFDVSDQAGLSAAMQAILNEILSVPAKFTQ